MQDFKPCSSLSGSGSLTDRRDNQVYTVAKINGNWWMTRNLAIGCNGSGSSYGSSVSSKQLTSTYSNVSTAWSTPTALLSNASSSTQTADYTTPRMQCSSTYGAWYNYATATAGTITGSSNTDTQTYDICPKGWRLPTKSQFDGITSYRSDFFNGGSSVVGGRYYNGGLILSNYGFWWSATQWGDTARYDLKYYSNNLSTDTSGRYDGNYVRCVWPS